MQPRGIEGYRLSPQQRRLWLSLQNSSESPYRVQCIVEISGDLDARGLKEAFLCAANGNEILRTHFCLLPEMVYPAQVVRGVAEIAFHTYNLASLSEQEQSGRLDAMYNDHLKRELKIEHGPVLCVSSLRLSPTNHVLLMTMMALCGDSKTLANLLSEVVSFYGRKDVNATARSEEKIQYVVISEWQNDLLESEDTRAGRDYWAGKNGLKEALAQQRSDTDTREGMSFRPRSLALSVPAEINEKLKHLAVRNRIQIQSLLLACWKVELWRMMPSEKTLVGVAFDGRTDPDLENTLGPLTRFLPIITSMNQKLEMSELARQLEESCKEARQWQEYFSWEDISGGKKGEGEYFLYSFESDQAWEEKAGNVWMRMVRRYACTERYKVKLSSMIGQRIEVEVQYDEGEVSRSEAELIASRYIQVIKETVGREGIRVGEVEILSEEERWQVLGAWNATSRDYDRSRSVHQQIEEIARSQPHSIAVEYEGEQVSYEELNRRANQLARYLRNRGVGADAAVGIMLDRSLELVIGLLGILKAGAAYVPLDPNYPKQRLLYMVGDSRASIIVVESKYEALVEKSDAELIVINKDQDELAAEATDDLEPVICGENLAYIIYTSGSTGQPKGAMILHRSLYNHMLWMLSEFPLSSNDSVLQKTPYSFDASVWEFFAPLMSGARLVMARNGGHQDITYLAQEIIKSGITILQVVPTLLRSLVGNVEIKECDSLKRVFSGGEALTIEVVEDFKRKTKASLTNLYGPTETTIEVSYWTCKGGEGERRVPIGRAITNASLYVMDERQRVAGAGMWGELYIGGECLGRGYIGRGDQTADRYAPNPYGMRGGERLYRTGDIVRYRPDGVLEYKGREDKQVKVRGYRVELGEIEEALEQHPDVLHAVAMVGEDHSGDNRLVAYVMARAGAQVNKSEIRSFIKTRLPAHTVPASLVILDRLPLLPNGKIDHNSLAAAQVVDDPDELRIAPRTLIEETMAGIWMQILQTNKRLSLQDSFFDLGGHSLLATQIISRIREVFDVDFPLVQLFDNPTIASMAEGIEALLKAGARTLLPPIERVARDYDLPLSFAQQRLWFMHHLDPDTTFYHLPTAVRMTGHLDRDALSRSVKEIVRRHEVLRTTFTQVNGVPVQIITSADEVVVTAIDLSVSPEDVREAEAHRIVIADSKRPFDLVHGPLLRTTLIKLGEDDHVFVITIHHIVFDNWSTGILIRELCALYESFSSNVHAELPELSIQYADFAFWQRTHLKGDLLERQLSYWKEKLSGSSPALKLPTDHRRPVDSSFRSLKHSVLFPAELSAALKSLSNQEGTTLFITTLAAFYCLLYRYTGQHDITLGSPIVNRPRPETDGLIGFFVNHLVLRADLSGNPGFRQLLGRVRSVALGAYAHQDLPFEKLVEEMQPERKLSHMPLFNVAFALQNAPSSELKITGLKLRGFRTGQGMTVLDLLLMIIETNDGLVASMSGLEDLYKLETIREMLNHYIAILEQIAAQPDAPLLSLALPSRESSDFHDASSLLNKSFEIEQFNF